MAAGKQRSCCIDIAMFLISVLKMVPGKFDAVSNQKPTESLGSRVPFWAPRNGSLVCKFDAILYCFPLTIVRVVGARR